MKKKCKVCGSFEFDTRIVNNYKITTCLLCGLVKTTKPQTKEVITRLNYYKLFTFVKYLSETSTIQGKLAKELLETLKIGGKYDD